MLQSGTFIQTVDNLGVKELKCIRVLGALKKQRAKLGDFISASIREIRIKKTKRVNFKKGDVVTALVVQTRATTHRDDGQKIHFMKNSAILVDKQKKILGTRINSPACKEFRRKKFLKLVNLTTQSV